MNTLSPAAGPTTTKREDEKTLKKIAPIIAEIIPASAGAFEAMAIPAVRGREIKNKDQDDKKSFLVTANGLFFITNLIQ
jgi:hypothetical protein